MLLYACALHIISSIRDYDRQILTEAS